MNAHAGEMRGDARADLPEIRQWLMRPQFLPEAHLVQLGYPHPVLVGGQLLGGDVHGDFRQVQVGANAPRGGDTLGGQHIPDHGGDQFVGGLIVEMEVGR